MGDEQRKVRELREELKNRREELRDAFFSENAARGNGINPKIDRRRDLKGHFQKIYSIHWAGRGSDLLVSASQDGKLIVWNANSTNKLNAIPLKTCWVMSCAFEQRNNQLVASGGLDNICSVYRLGEHEVGAAIRPERELEGHLGYISCCRFMDESRIVTSSGDSTCRYWDIERGTCLFYFKEHTGDVMGVSPHPTNTNVFVSGSVDLECKLWDIRAAGPQGYFKGQSQAGPNQGRQRFNHFRYDDPEEIEGDEVRSRMSYPGHESDVNGVAFFPDGYAFGSGSDDATCRLFDLRCHQEVNIFKHQTILCGITSVDFSSSGRILFAGYDDHNLLGWDVLQNPSPETGEADPVVCWKRHEARVSSVSVHSEGLALATASWDTFIKVYA